MFDKITTYPKEDLLITARTMLCSCNAHLQHVVYNVNYRRMRDMISNKEHEIVSLRRQLDSTSEELTEVGRAREVALRENRRLQDDLSTMTRENQVSAQILLPHYTRVISPL